MSEAKKIKPSLSKGTRDFLPAEVAKRNYIFNTIKGVFRKYGFEEIETPAIERLETLTGKYGEEGDKLLFKILNSGNALAELNEADIELQKKFHEAFHQELAKRPKDYFNQLVHGDSSDFNKEMIKVANKLTEKGLRYDLTVPLARYVVQHQDNLAFPFKRFHIGPVWRADRPQKGRYQEFYQCDADIIGSNSPLLEAELTIIFIEVFSLLNLDVEIRVNSRKMLEAMCKYAECKERIAEITTLIDKIDKVGVDGIQQDLIKLNLSERQIAKINSFITAKNISGILPVLNSIDSGMEAYGQVYGLLDRVKSSKVIFDPTLARGLNYYTGIIWEVKANNVQMGSIASGGRYDNLTEMFGGQNMSGVGISFGIERIYDVMEELNLFPKEIVDGVKVILVPREAGKEEFAFQQTKTLRDAGISAEIYLGNIKKHRLFDYVERKNIAYIIEVGDNEVLLKKFRLRNVKTRETENDLSLEQIIAKLK